MRAASIGLGLRTKLIQWRIAPSVTPKRSAAALAPPTDSTHDENLSMPLSIRNVSEACKRNRYRLDACHEGCCDIPINMSKRKWHETAKSLMRDRGISIRALSDTLGVTPGGAGHYLSGRRNPTPGMLKKIADAIGVSVSELIEDDPSFARDQTEHEALEAFRNIPPGNVSAALAMLRALGDTGSNHAPDVSMNQSLPMAGSARPSVTH